MAALQYDLPINQGETCSFTFPVFDGSGDPLTVDGWTAKAQIRRYPHSVPVFYEWSADNNNIVVSGTSVTLQLPAADSASWTWNNGYYDLYLYDPDSTPTRIAEGAVRVSSEVTR
jgi:hypothetical protein